jgi:hypothetical protein
MELGHEEDVGVHGVAFQQLFEALAVELAGCNGEQGADGPVVEVVEHPGAFVLDPIQHVLDDILHVFEGQIPFQFLQQAQGFASGVG